MADTFHEVFEGLKQTAEGIVIANEGMVIANQGIKRAVEAALAAKDEHEDVRETVHRLESLVTEQGRQIQTLRQAWTQAFAEMVTQALADARRVLQQQLLDSHQGKPQ